MGVGAFGCAETIYQLHLQDDFTHLIAWFCACVQSIMDQNVLSKPSIFWAVITIALNTMSQPTGRTLGFPQRYNFVLRCSPVVCAAHVVGTITGVGYTTVRAYNQGSSIRNATATWVSKRYAGASPDSTFANVRKGSKLIFVLFALGTLLQAIKIFAVEGIRETQIVCSAYLAAFIVDEATVFLAPKETATVQLSTEDIDEGCEVDSFGTTFLAALISPTQVTDIILLGPPPNIGIDFSVLGTGPKANSMLGAIYALPYILLSYYSLLFVIDTRFRSRQNRQWLADLGSLSFMGSCVFSYGAAALLTATLKRLESQAAMAVIRAFTALMSSVFLVESDRKPSGERSTGYGRYFLAGFLIHHIIGVIIGYWVVYKPETTFKPTWTEYLG
jgi:hypothetical protein